MIRVYNKLFCSPEYTKFKSQLYFLRTFADQNDSYELVDDASQPCIILVFPDVITVLSDESLKEIAETYNQTPGNKIVIDTSLEEFVKEPYYHCVSKLLRLGVSEEDIFVLAGQTATSTFVNDFKIPFTTFSINTFETAFMVHTKMDNIEVPEIAPRKLKKHFISFIKNARFIRRVFHAHLKTNGHLDKTYATYHNLSEPYSRKDIDWLKLFHFINPIADNNESMQQLEDISKVINIDNIFETGEWNYPSEVLKHGGISLNHETHALLNWGSLPNDPIYHRVFLTEKTYKNFFYGIPHLSLGIPKENSYLQQLGYKGFESLFKTKISDTGYISCFQSYFELIDEIASMSLQELEDLLNSEECIKRLKHNQDRFLQQNEFKKLLEIFNTISDKY